MSDLLQNFQRDILHKVRADSLEANHQVAPCPGTQGGYMWKANKDTHVMNFF